MKHPYFNEDYEMFRKAFRKFLDKEAYPYYEQWEKEHIIPREFWRKLGENGFLCPDLPEEYGGSGVDWGYSIVFKG